MIHSFVKLKATPQNNSYIKKTQECNPMLSSHIQEEKNEFKKDKIINLPLMQQH